MGGTIRRVKKTSIYLEPELDFALARRASAFGVTKAELIRETLRQAVGQPRPRIKAIGVGEGPGDVSSDIDAALERTGYGRS